MRRDHCGAGSRSQDLWESRATRHGVGAKERRSQRPGDRELAERLEGQVARRRRRATAGDRVDAHCGREDEDCKHIEGDGHGGVVEYRLHHSESLSEKPLLSESLRQKRLARHKRRRVLGGKEDSTGGPRFELVGP